LIQKWTKIIGDDLQALEFGWLVGMPLCRSISSYKGLWELRSDLNNGRISIVLFSVSKNRLILLQAFFKKTGKTPVHDLKIARRKNEKKYPMIKEKNIGSTLEDFLKEENRYEEAQSQAIKNEKITKAEMARRMHTSRFQLDRLLDPENEDSTGYCYESSRRHWKTSPYRACRSAAFRII